MTGVEVVPSSETDSENRSALIFGLEDNPPFQTAILVALQHVCVIFVPSVTPAILIGRALNLDAASISYIIGMTLFVAGFATFVQARRIGPIGSGLLSIQGPSFAFLPPIFSVIATASAAGRTPEETLALILGLGFFGSFIQIILSRFLQFAQVIFPPIVTGTAVTLIGLTLIRFGMHDMAGGDVAQEAGDYGSLKYWAVSFPVFLTVAICSANSNRFLRMGSVIIGLLVGAIIAALMGMTDFSQLGSIPLFNIPIPFRFGLDFNLAAFIPFAIIYFATSLEVVGDITATSMVTGEPIKGSRYIRRLKGGLLGDGFNSFIASCCSTLPTVTLSQNNGIIQLTGVGSRYIGFYVAGILAFLGLFPIVGGVLTAIPAPVFGAAILLMFGTVAVAGFNILREIEMTNRSLVIVGASLAAGLGVTFIPDALAGFPEQIRSILESGISVGSLCALLLNLVLPKSIEDKMSENSATSDPDKSPLSEAN
ncbi:MAG: uracil-xanthine permease family protein [Cyanophyceae cyanobacterium]